MTRWLLFAILKVVAVAMAYLFAPIFVRFAEPRIGPVNNFGGWAVEPRLPRWLAWFDTPDNSLWGDDGWKREHSVALGLDYKSPAGMAAWIKRNPCYGLGWSLLSAPISSDTFFWYSGNLEIDNENGIEGELLIWSSNGYWQKKVVKRWPWSKTAGYMKTTGWLLDPYVKNPQLWKSEPLAIFQLEPRLVRLA